MSLFIQQNDNRSKLQEKLETELRAKAKIEGQSKQDLPDGITDSNYLKDTKTTTSLAWIWIAIAVIVIGLFIIYIVGSSK